MREESREKEIGKAREMGVGCDSKWRHQEKVTSEQRHEGGEGRSPAEI